MECRRRRAEARLPLPRDIARGRREDGCGTSVWALNDESPPGRGGPSPRGRAAALPYLIASTGVKRGPSSSSAATSDAKRPVSRRSAPTSPRCATAFATSARHRGSRYGSRSRRPVSNAWWWRQHSGTTHSGSSQPPRARDARCAAVTPVVWRQTRHHAPRTFPRWASELPPVDRTGSGLRESLEDLPRWGCEPAKPARLRKRSRSECGSRT